MKILFCKSFLNFKRSCRLTTQSEKLTNLTKYFYDKNKTVELDIRPEELFMAADAEVSKKKAFKKTAKHS